MAASRYQPDRHLAMHPISKKQLLSYIGTLNVSTMKTLGAMPAGENIKLEKDLELLCRRIVERADGKLLKFVSPGNKGVPDRILILRGVIAFIEFKKPGRHKVQPLQGYWHQYLSDMLMPVYRIQTLAEFNRVFKTLKDQRPRPV